MEAVSFNMFTNTIAGLLIAIGVGFYLAGTIGLLRFPDVYMRLHAMTKADNLGLGFVILGLGLYRLEPFTILKLLFIWLLVLVASTTTCHLAARSALHAGIKPLRGGQDS